MKKAILTAALIILPFPALAQTLNKLVIETRKGEVTINKNLYGHFAEHLGRCIYDGIWVGPDSPIPNVKGYRKDILDALKALDIPVLRWPGGCFADTYHWKDGVGPTEKRPTIMNYHWGGVTENNSFGTHEFLNLCEMLGCDAYVSANVGSGTVQEMTDWIEYMTSDKDVPMANWRRANGRDKPWNVKFLGVGNESWGCGGAMSPEHYSDLLRNFVEFAYIYGRDRFTRIGCGANSGDYRWTEVVMERRHSRMEALSLHYYTIAGESWAHKSAATGFGEPLYFSGLQKALHMKELVENHSAIMDKFDPGKRVGLMVDEWGIWTDVEPGTNPGFLFQQNSMRDALIAALTLDIFNNHADRVKMANIAQTVNVLQSVILTQGDQIVLTPTYHVFNLYKVHQDATLLPTQLACESYELDGKEIPALTGSASRDRNGAVHITLSNLHASETRKVSVELVGGEFANVAEASVLTAPAFNSYNSFENPDIVKPAPFRAYEKASSTQLNLDLPPKSIVALELN
jgi:alpha-N-arabinofuranosidase